MTTFIGEKSSFCGTGEKTNYSGITEVQDLLGNLPYTLTLLWQLLMHFEESSSFGNDN